MKIKGYELNSRKTPHEFNLLLTSLKMGNLKTQDITSDCRLGAGEQLPP